MQTVQVGLGERAYPIIIDAGLLQRIGSELVRLGIAKRYAIISDQHVAELYGQALLDSCRNAGLDCPLITFPNGENSKNISVVGELASKLAVLGFDRKDGLIALGGGVTGDITGFLAAIYMRGIPFIQIPTSLLAQVDSSVGGKTGVDIPEGKNLVGVFYQPRSVFIDTDVLSTLPHGELLNGLAEVIKYSVIYDATFFDFLTANRERILQLDQETLAQVIMRCCSIKAEVVAADEREADLRRILNFGHTLGHAVEAASDFAIAHGQAVAIGMVAAADLAVEKKLLAEEDVARIKRLIRDYGLPVTIPGDLDRARIKRYLKTDKKAVSGRPFFVLPTAIGKVVITDEVETVLIDNVLR